MMGQKLIHWANCAAKSISYQSTSDHGNGFCVPAKITRLEIEFRNPDGTLCYFQGRDHTMTLGFVIDRPTLAITSGSLTGMIDTVVR